MFSAQLIPSLDYVHSRCSLHKINIVIKFLSHRDCCHSMGRLNSVCCTHSAYAVWTQWLSKICADVKCFSTPSVCESTGKCVSQNNQQHRYVLMVSSMERDEIDMSLMRVVVRSLCVMRRVRAWRASMLFKQTLHEISDRIFNIFHSHSHAATVSQQRVCPSAKMNLNEKYLWRKQVNMTTVAEKLIDFIGFDIVIFTLWNKLFSPLFWPTRCAPHPPLSHRTSNNSSKYYLFNVIIKPCTDFFFRCFFSFSLTLVYHSAEK